MMTDLSLSLNLRDDPANRCTTLYSEHSYSALQHTSYDALENFPTPMNLSFKESFCEVQRTFVHFPPEMH